MVVWFVEINDVILFAGESGELLFSVIIIMYYSVVLLHYRWGKTVQTAKVVTFNQYSINNRAETSLTRRFDSTSFRL